MADNADCDSREELENSMKTWKTPTAIGFIIAILWMIFCGFLMPPSWPTWITWIVTLAIFIFIGGLVGLSITNRWSGIFINERKLMSISRVQMALWTLIVLSGFFAIFIGRLRSGNVSDPLDITIDWQIWAVMGISGASFAGRSLIAGKKASTESADRGKDAEKVAKPLVESDLKTGKMTEEQKKLAIQNTQKQIADNAEGVLFVNNCIKDAEFMDMFEQDEVRYSRFIDMGKLQMFFFTIIALISYSVALFALMYNTKDPSQINQLPPLSDGLVAILGISHAALLGNSAITQTPVKPS